MYKAIKICIKSNVYVFLKTVSGSSRDKTMVSKFSSVKANTNP